MSNLFQDYITKMVSGVEDKMPRAIRVLSFQAEFINPGHYQVTCLLSNGCAMVAPFGTPHAPTLDQVQRLYLNWPEIFLAAPTEPELCEDCGNSPKVTRFYCGVCDKSIHQEEQIDTEK